MSESGAKAKNELKDNIMTPLTKDSLNYSDNKEKFIINKNNCVCLIILNFNSILLGAIFFGILFLTNSALYKKIIWLLLVLFLVVLFNCLYMKKSEKIIELIKDVKNNTFEINILNYFNKKLFNTILNLNSIIIYDSSYGEESPESTITYGLIIVNTFENKSDIDLDRSDIRNKPKKIFYLLDDVKNDNLKSGLISFVGCPSEPTNPVFLDVNQYMGKPQNNSLPLTFGNYKINKYMKISDTFFTFFFNEFGGCDCLFSSINCIMGLVSATFLIVLFSIDTGIAVILLLLLLSLTILFLFNFVYYCFYFKCKKKFISRIDIIYSNNFDRIFIGLVNYNENAYINTILLEIQSIEKFVIEPLNRSKKKNDLKVVLKIKKIELICRINEDYSALEGLLYILNEKLDTNPYDINNYDNLLVKS